MTRYGIDDLVCQPIDGETHHHFSRLLYRRFILRDELREQFHIALLNEKRLDPPPGLLRWVPSTQSSDVATEGEVTRFVQRMVRNLEVA